jgi:hypothetical protein
MKPNIAYTRRQTPPSFIAIADLAGTADVSHRTYEYYAVVFRQPQRTKLLPVRAIYNTSFDVVGRSSAVLNIVNSCFGDYTASGLVFKNILVLSIMLDADITMSVTIDGFVAVARLITISTNDHIRVQFADRRFLR